VHPAPEKRDAGLGTYFEIEVRMAIRVKARSGEGVEQMLRRFKKLCEKEGLTKDIKRKEFYEKPSERRRRDARKSQNRRVREDMPMLDKKAEKKPDRRPAAY
jgi:small subunit ribosomal protein S21